MKKGKLIVVEGACDGIGKTTQYEMLRRRFIDDDEKIASHHFPSYGTYQGVPVEKYLKGEFGKISELNPYFVNSLYAIDRGITWYQDLKGLYEEGKILLLDRYTTSSLIYQSALIDNINQRKNFIDYAPFDLVAQMRNARKQNEGIANDIHERDLEFMKKVYNNAMFIADYLSWDRVQCNIGNKMRDINDIHEEIYSLVKKKM